MLRQRVITALLLVAVFLPALFHPDPTGLAVLSLVLITAAGWEWGRLVGWSGRAAAGLGLTCLLTCLVSWRLGLPQAHVAQLWWPLSLFWVLGSVWLLRRGLSGWGDLPQGLRAALGVLVLWATWLALFEAKMIGTNFTLSVLLLVWVADIAAYFSGRAWGRRKLAPSISPGKTWEGAGGAVLGVLLLAWLWIRLDASQTDWSPSVYTLLFQAGWGLGLPALLGLVAMSVMGDLIESLIKRSAGVKDSSQLLPGHGGVLDRVDALLPTLPLALCLSLWVNS
jgi:phosphatidate cytidylyltransferase